jgi:hypothetical protein
MAYEEWRRWYRRGCAALMEAAHAEALRCFERMPVLREPKRNAVRELALARALAADPAGEDPAIAKIKRVLHRTPDRRIRRWAALELARVLEGPPNAVRSGTDYASAIAVLQTYLEEEPDGDATVERVIERLERKRARPLARAAELLDAEYAVLNARQTRDRPGWGFGARPFD